MWRPSGLTVTHERPDPARTLGRAAIISTLLLLVTYAIVDLWMKGGLPFLGGLMLLGAFGIASYQYAQPSYGRTTIFGIGGVFVIGIGALVFGGVLMLVYRVVAPAFFLGETLARRGAHDLVLAGMAQEPLSERDSVGVPS